MLNYNFFDYKYNIEGFSGDIFSTPHIVYIVLAYISAIALAVLFRNAKHKNITIFLRILSIFVLIFEIIKISWESYYDITTGRGFNVGGILPLYTCSLFIYTLLVAAWTKGLAKEISLSFLSTIGLLSGAVVIVYCNGLNFYPFWTFGAWYSLLFHYLMFLTGLIVLSSRYKKLSWIDTLYSWIPIVLIFIVANPINYILQSDYMLIYSASGVPFMNDLGNYLASNNLRPLFTVIMLFSYIIVSVVVILLYKAILKLNTTIDVQRKNRKKFSENYK